MEITRIFLLIATAVVILHAYLWHTLDKKLEGIHPIMFHGNVIWPFRKQTFMTRIQDKLGYYYFWTLRHPRLSEWPYAIFIITLSLDVFV